MLKGSIPAEVGLLSNMEFFLVEDMEITGPIEEVFTKWHKVLEIRMNDNRLTGKVPDSLDLDNPLLAVLRLDKNQLSGPVPPSLGSLVGLKYLGLGENLLQNGIPTELGNLGNLSK